MMRRAASSAVPASLGDWAGWLDKRVLLLTPVFEHLRKLWH